jgi:hypothetical protein
LAGWGGGRNVETQRRVRVHDDGSQAATYREASGRRARRCRPSP